MDTLILSISGIDADIWTQEQIPSRILCKPEKWCIMSITPWRNRLWEEEIGYRKNRNARRDQGTSMQM